jgi:hypothetical protein
VFVSIWYRADGNVWRLGCCGYKHKTRKSAMCTIMHYKKRLSNCNTVHLAATPKKQELLTKVFVSRVVIVGVVVALRQNGTETNPKKKCT